MSDSASTPTPGRPQRASLAARCGLAIGASILTLVVAFGVTEITMRVLDLGIDPLNRSGKGTTALAHRHAETPGLLYELVPDARIRTPTFLIQVNGDGLRGPEIEPKGTFVRRIAVLGDSTTFGHGVEYRETYSAVLQELLNAADSHWSYQVLDFGVSGYSTRDEAVVLRQKVPRFDPDLVVVGYNLNDPEFEPRQPLSLHFAPPAWWEHFEILRQLERSQHVLRLRLLGDGNYFRYLHAEGHPPWQSVADGFADMVSSASGIGVSVLLAIFPFGEVPLGERAYAYGDLHAQVAKAATAAGMEVLDLAAVYRAAGPNPSYLLRDNHPNPLGHRIAARALAERILADDGALFRHDV